MSAFKTLVGFIPTGDGLISYPRCPMKFSDVKIADLVRIQDGIYEYGSYIVQISNSGKATVWFHGGAQ
ncbi:hypothetical protein MRCP2_p1920 (plasmid) [Aquipseudomonas alcaligenes]|nr:hypothetical protein MRCP2_p1920 [Pseudomonas alcaligenes]